MARPKLPTELVKETLGIKLDPATIRELEAIGAARNLKPSAVAREFLLIGMAATEALRGNTFLAGLLQWDETQATLSKIPQRIDVEVLTESADESEEQRLTS